jgi:hypothetical protein
LGGDERHFWFGFYSNRARIQRLSQELSPVLRQWAKITDYDFQENGPLTLGARRQVEREGGLVLEQYEDNEHYFGKFDIGFTATSDDQLARQGARFVGDIINLVQPAQAADVDEIQNRTDIDATTRKQLIDARRGQGQFRSELFERWRGCSVTSCIVEEVLRASHIKPWRSSSDQERLDVNNGLLLIATLDALFDRGLVSFKDEGEMMVSTRLHKDQMPYVLHPERRNLRAAPSDAQKRYLTSHRKKVFQQ